MFHSLYTDVTSSIKINISVYVAINLVLITILTIDLIQKEKKGWLKKVMVLEVFAPLILSYYLVYMIILRSTFSTRVCMCDYDQFYRDSDP